jgi:hypothetical protein
LRSVGPAIPALAHGDPDTIRTEVLAAIEPGRDARGTYRFRNDHQIVIARKPDAVPARTTRRSIP